MPVEDLGELRLLGRIMHASNATFLATCADTVDDGGAVPAEPRQLVYKPIAGERALWDFPSGNLAFRERAAYVVSEALGWNIVPTTVLADGPHGLGMVQDWQEPDEDLRPVDVVGEDEVPDGFRVVLSALDEAGEPVSVIHEDTPALRRIALFDVVINNGDRKGGHVLPQRDGHRYGIDHGVSFHVENKLRTVLWGWMDEPLLTEERAALTDLRDRIGGELGVVLAPLLDEDEIDAIDRRCAVLLRSGKLPQPEGSWPPIPWPPF